ncbi:hypothetical protein DICPUDRAFT_87760 [Dictyostelium purpureum]|uniref:Peptidase S54 rhomboid domain-containing protein n=1 Tax=Dictyostelium purpureum TaxID=5786 RepID=F0ZK61_DICPU|nr:uncharacterized protein DICPUDRAFT_87760 [Dictyostelium purpureum]EGC35665.1 hypothetical protein DICPUDRAFT_87760 [Dictyostelium purpureum]|eukprot:XP_003287798.1 hypothetical protein DICPUDRAFT_87760 [Dictyostelium purpureum]
MFRNSINNLSNKINKRQFESFFSTIKCINKNERIIFIKPTILSSKSKSSNIKSSTSSIFNINNNNNKFNTRFYSTKNEKINENINNNNNNNNENNNENNNNQQNENFNFEFLNRNKKRILYSAGIVSMGLFSVYGGSPNDNNNTDDYKKQNVYEFYGFKIKERDLVIGSIIALNTIIFALLKNPAFYQKFALHFYCSPQTIQKYPASIILSTFTHTEVLHFAFNMYALFNFGGVVYDSLGFRDFLLLYVLGGLVGSMSSLTFKLMTKGFEIPSIGASGSILSIVGASVFLEKESRLSIMFLPISFEPISFIHCLMLFDLAGCLIRPLSKLTSWDHAAHFGSTLLGYCIGHSYQYKTRFQNFNGQGKMNGDGFYYNGTIKNGEYSGYGELKDPRYIRRGVFQDGRFLAGEITLRATGQKKIFQRPPQQPGNN